MKTSCLHRVEHDSIIICRASYIAICDNNKDAALLLSYLEYWQNQNTQLMHSHKIDDIRKQNLGYLSERGINKGRKILKEKGFLTEHKNPIKRYKFDNTIFYQIHPEAINQKLKEYEETDGVYNALI